MHVLSAEQFSPDDLQDIFARADVFQAIENHPDPAVRHANRRNLTEVYRGRFLCNLFYEESTRTRLGFGRAALALGMGVEGTENARVFSSAAKGETLEHTIRVLNEYKFDIIVLRHDQTGAAARAAAVSDAPIFNAGDGKGEHPTQAILDAHTIYRKFGRLDNLHVTMVGDLRNGRTINSLARVLSKYPDNKLSFVSVPELQIGVGLRDYLRTAGTEYEETEDLYSVLGGADVIYAVRLQRERLAAGEAYATKFVIDQKALDMIRRDAIIAHPMPITDEIDPVVDTDPRAWYFRQVGIGRYDRMALIERQFELFD